MPFQEKISDQTVTRLRAQRLVRLRGAHRGSARISLLESAVDTASTAPKGNTAADGTERSGARSRSADIPSIGAILPLRPLFSSTIAYAHYGETDEAARRAVLCVFSVLPEPARREIEGVLRANGCATDALEEIRLSLDAKSSIVVRGQEKALSLSLSKEDISFTVRGVCHGTPFSYRAELAEGYLPFVGGVRVGAVGEAHYDEARQLVGVSDLHTLIFRIPHGTPKGEAVERLCSYLCSNMLRGCLILGTPRSGKTTLLRALCASLCSGDGARRVSVVDTRREFLPEDGCSGLMDILRAYRRCEGASIALRTLSPAYIAMDEVGAREDAEAIRAVLCSGVPLLATAHAKDPGDAYGRRHLRVLLEEGAFDHLLVIQRMKEGARLSLYRV